VNTKVVAAKSAAKKAAPKASSSESTWCAIAASPEFSATHHICRGAAAPAR
jgi:hypothetical protein